MLSCYVPHSTRINERGKQPASSHSRLNSDMQMSNTNICTSQMRTADAQLFLRGLFRDGTFYVRDSQLQRTQEPRNSFRTHPRAAILYARIKKGGRVVIQLLENLLFTNKISALMLLIQAAIFIFCRRITVC